MDTDIEEFRTELCQHVKASAIAGGEYTREALFDELASRLVRGEELPEHLPCYYSGAGSYSRQLLIDGYSDNDIGLDGSIHMLVVIDGDQHNSEILTTPDINTAYKQAIGFYADSVSGYLAQRIEPSHPAHGLATLIYDGREAIKVVRVFVLSDLPVSKGFKPSAREPVGSADAELHVWDLSRFFKLAAAGGHDPIDLDVTEYVPEGIPTLRASTGATDHQSYLCVVPGSFLADVYERYGGRLLEGNVRAFLSARGNVNKGLRATIRLMPTRFFAYNNGITATASSVTLGPSGRLTRILDLQIVNGGQTTASLYNTRERDKAKLEEIYVQMKLSVVTEDLALELIPDIARYANTQNKVSEADLFANHAFNRRVEEIARRVWAPGKTGADMTHWFYERARAQYETEQMKLSTAKRRVFLLQNPKKQVITKTDIAKVENTWRQRPYEVSLGAQKNFARYSADIVRSWELDEHSFNEAWFRNLVAKTIVFGETERIVSNAVWYQHGFRANIVTYTIAKLLYMVELEYPGMTINLREVWRTQAIPKLLEIQIEAIGGIAQEVLVKPDSPWKNVTEWAKRSQCWEKLTSTEAPLVDGLEGALGSRYELDSEIKSDRREASDNAKISNVVRVVNLARTGYWVRALESADSARELTSVELGILRKAVLKGAGWVPNDPQAKRLMEAKRKLDGVGFN